MNVELYVKFSQMLSIFSEVQPDRAQVQHEYDLNYLFAGRVVKIENNIRFTSTRIRVLFVGWSLGAVDSQLRNVTLLTVL